MNIEITRLPHSAGLPLPAYASAGAAGLDLYAAVIEDTIITPGRTVPIPTGLAIALPTGYEGQVRPRSGLARDYNVSLMNSPGTIDSDYRGEIVVLLVSFSEPFVVRRGDRIAQLVITRYERIEWKEVERLPPTMRGAGGFGHSGV
ncbi:MAG: dUTP diphosphatase [Calditrichaeota bacterium]|nr:dUTP diphosphatase [Calditrichota bacterium]